MSTNDERLRAALQASVIALDDWLHEYAPEWCGEPYVSETRERIASRGGTIAYIAKVQQENRGALEMLNLLRRAALPEASPREYKHFVTCNADRRQPAGESSGCSCFNGLHAAAVPQASPPQKPCYILGRTTIERVANEGQLETERVAFVAADELFHRNPYQNSLTFTRLGDLAQKGLEDWKSKGWNKKWWKRIDGTPIPNDLIVCIAERMSKELLAAVPEASPRTDETVLRIKRIISSGENSSGEFNGDTELAIRQIQEVLAAVPEDLLAAVPEASGEPPTVDALRFVKSRSTEKLALAVEFFWRALDLLTAKHYPELRNAGYNGQGVANILLSRAAAPASGGHEHTPEDTVRACCSCGGWSCSQANITHKLSAVREACARQHAEHVREVPK